MIGIHKKTSEYFSKRLLKKSSVFYFFPLLIILWSLLIFIIALVDIIEIKNVTKRIAIKEVRTHFNREQAFRFWGASHGGVYVPVSEITQPNKYLTHIEDRDITAPSGKKLTLMNPAFMVRQMGEFFSELYGVTGHLTSLKPLNPGNKPDEWEDRMLRAFEKGASESIEFTQLNGSEHLRFMRPLFVEAPCLKCHKQQGYKLGDVRGGISIALPMGGYRKDERQELLFSFVLYSFIWLLGVVGIYISMQWFKKRKLAEEKMQLSEQRYTELIEISRDIIFTLNAEGLFVSLNSAFELITGWNRFSWIGKRFSAIIHPEDIAFATRMLSQTLKGQIPPVIEVRFLTKDNQHKTIELLNTPLIQNDKIVGIFGIGRDISDRKEIEEDKKKIWGQLLHSQKIESIGRLTGSLAHDFNNILTGILGYAELSFRDSEESSNTNRRLGIIIECCHRAARLTRQLLAYSRKQVLEIKASNLNSIIDNMSNMLFGMLKDDINLEIRASKAISNVRVDVSQIELILMNLLLNARDAMPNGGSLVIETRDVELDIDLVKDHHGARPGRYVMLSISDTGVGMSKEIKENIFEPFFTTKEKGRGTGLGLSTVFGIVTQHDAFIVVDTEPGKGTTFKIYFPTTVEEAAALKRKRKQVMTEGTETILVVDDEEIIRQVAIETLKPMKYKLLEAANGDEALRVCKDYSETIDLLITDIVMPGMNGWQLVEEIKKIRPNIKVLFSSASLDNPIVLNNIMKHEVPFINKPFTTEKLAVKVRQTLDAPVKDIL